MERGGINAGVTEHVQTISAWTTPVDNVTISVPMQVELNEVELNGAKCSATVRPRVNNGGRVCQTLIHACLKEQLNLIT